MKRTMKVAMCSLFLLTAVVTVNAQSKTAAVKAPVAKDVLMVAAEKPLLTDFAAQAGGQAEVSALLKSAGPYTILAPSNEAFAKLQGAGGDMAAVLKAHVFEGQYNLTAILDAIRANNWKTTLTALDGSVYTFTVENGKVKITNAAGVSALISSYNIQAANGVIHIIDTVLPK